MDNKHIFEKQYMETIQVVDPQKCLTDRCVMAGKQETLKIFSRRFIKYMLQIHIICTSVACVLTIDHTVRGLSQIVSLIIPYNKNKIE